MRHAAFAFAVGVLLQAAPVHARQADPAEPAPLGDADAFDVDDGALRTGVRAISDARLLLDHVDGLPGGRAAVSRARLDLRPGLEYTSDTGLVVRVVARLSASSQSTPRARLDNANSRGSDAAVDEAWVEAPLSDALAAQLGKGPLPIVLTPLLWDPDLRPIGVTLTGQHAAGRGGFVWAATAQDIDHPLAAGPRMAVAQGSWTGPEGMAIAPSVRVAILRFDGLDAFARAGLARGNAVVAGRFATAMQLVDLQLGLRLQQSLLAPLELHLDTVRNTAAAPGRRDAYRAALAWGDLSRPRAWKASLIAQRVQADAVVAALTSDEWWFHAGYRGQGLVVEHAANPRLTLAIKAFAERRDGLDERTLRGMAEARLAW